MALSFSPKAFFESAKELAEDIRLGATGQRKIRHLLADWWDDEVWHFLEPPRFRYQLTVRDSRMSKEAGFYPKDLMDDERYVADDPRIWLEENARGPYTCKVAASGRIFFIKFARKSDMALFILACCEA